MGHAVEKVAKWRLYFGQGNGIPACLSIMHFGELKGFRKTRTPQLEHWATLNREHEPALPECGTCVDAGSRRTGTRLACTRYACAAACAAGSRNWFPRCTRNDVGCAARAAAASCRLPTGLIEAAGKPAARADMPKSSLRRAALRCTTHAASFRSATRTRTRTLLAAQAAAIALWARACRLALELHAGAGRCAQPRCGLP